MSTREALWAYRDRFGDAFGRTYFRRFGAGVASSVGLGTYFGEPTDAVDDAYRRVVRLALASGVNHLDTAVNYRCGRSERAVGDALQAAVREGVTDREAVVVATKGGFLPFDGERPDDPARYIRERFVDTGVVDPDDLVGGHCLAPDYITWSVDRSLDHLGVDTIDCYYLHNPEAQLAARSRSDVYDALEAAFERLERRRAAGEIGRYGVATWQAFRVPTDHESYLSLRDVLARAAAAGAAVGPGDDHGFAAVQLPFNVRMADAFTRANQRPPDDPDGEPISTLEFAHEAGLSVVTSASIGQGELAVEGAIPAGVDDRLAGDTPAQRALNFARSAPAVTCSLVGTTDTAHLRENVAAGTFDPLGASAFDATFE
ncbi:MAG: aldo/keto reductase [Halorubrum sp.]